MWIKVPISKKNTVSVHRRNWNSTSPAKHYNDVTRQYYRGVWGLTTTSEHETNVYIMCNCNMHIILPNIKFSLFKQLLYCYYLLIDIFGGYYWMSLLLVSIVVVSFVLSRCEASTLPSLAVPRWTMATMGRARITTGLHYLGACSCEIFNYNVISKV